MKIIRIRSWHEHVELKKPFTISYSTEDAVILHFVEIVSSNGLCGYGSAKPSKHVTGESTDSCTTALLELAPEVLIDMDPRQLPNLIRSLEKKIPKNPAALAALDMALHDLLARTLDIPLVEYFGRCHKTLPTSITLGIKNINESLVEAREWIRQGFSILKVKLGVDLNEDLEKIRQLRSEISPGMVIRVDPNQGYSSSQLLRFCKETESLDLQIIEQPLPVYLEEELLILPKGIRKSLAADESLHHPKDALRLIKSEPPFGIFNIKLMKCGGIMRGLQIASIAEAANIPLMWGCNTESRLSISAALHSAFSCPNTLYLDLDGDLDLVRDPFSGGYQLENGMMTINEEKGLGVKLS